MCDFKFVAKINELVPFLYCWKIKVKDVKDALIKMKNRKSVASDSLSIDMWKCIGNIGLKWLTKLFNKIWSSQRMSDSRRKSVIVPIYKSKRDIWNCSNYMGIKLMSHHEVMRKGSWRKNVSWFISLWQPIWFICQKGLSHKLSSC